jgi:hypothetical protein
MATIYFKELIISVVEEYEDVCESICNAEIHKERFIELNEFYQKFDESNSRFITTARKVFVRIDSIKYVHE